MPLNQQRIVVKTGKEKAPWVFLIWIIILHTFDMFRYGTNPFGPAYWIWVSMFIVHMLTAFFASSQLPVFRDAGGFKITFWIGIAAFLFGPLISLLSRYLPDMLVFNGLTTILLVIGPLWIWVLFPYTGNFPKLSAAWLILWAALIIFSFPSEVQQLATDQGYIGLSPGTALRVAYDKSSEAIGNFFKTIFVRAPKELGEEIKRQMALASGDYYSSKIDEEKGRRLGVFLEDFKAEQSSFAASRPAIVYATLSAETIDAPLHIRIECSVDDVPAAEIRPKATYNVLEFEQRDIDCIFDPYTIPIGTHKAEMNALFDFSSHAYTRLYLVDGSRAREIERLLPDTATKEPVTITTSGPVQVHMNLGQTPIRVYSGENLGAWEVQIMSKWSGKILGLTNLFFLTPKGIELYDISGTEPIQVHCSDLPVKSEDPKKPVCDDSLVNIYTLPADVLAEYKDETVIKFRAYGSVSDINKVLDTGGFSIQNFKVSAFYSYKLEQATEDFRIKAEASI